MGKKFTTFNSFFISSLLIPANIVAGKCTCDADDLQTAASRAAVLPYKVGALFAILLASALGILIPLLCQRFRALRPDGDIFFMVKAFAAGVILATGFIHILPDAFETLASPCITGEMWRGFPFAGLVAMAASIGALMIDTTATGYYRRAHFRELGVGKGVEVDVENEGEHGGHVHVHTHATHGHAHGDAARVVPEETNPIDLLRNRVTSQVLEAGVMIHSVIIGVSLGASGEISTIKPLMAALSFHQLFEGMGLAGCIVQAKFKCQAVVTMVIFFSLTTPFGVAIGIGISRLYNENSPTALVVQGVLSAAAAGILIYMALVDLLAADFMNPRLQNNPRIQLGSNISLLLGAGCMSVLAKWA